MTLKIVFFVLFTLAIVNGSIGPKSDLESCKLQRKKAVDTDPNNEGVSYKARDKGSKPEKVDDLVCEDDGTEDETSKPQHKVCKLHETCKPKPYQEGIYDSSIRGKGSKYDDTAFSEALKERYRNSEKERDTTYSSNEDDGTAVEEYMDSFDDFDEDSDGDKCPWLFSDSFFYVAPWWHKVSEFTCGPHKSKEDKIIILILLLIASAFVETFFLWMFASKLAFEHVMLLRHKTHHMKRDMDPTQVAEKLKLITKNVAMLHQRIMELNNEVEAMMFTE